MCTPSTLYVVSSTHASLPSPNGIWVGSAIFAKLTGMLTHSDTETTKCATSVATGRMWVCRAMHDVRRTKQLMYKLPQNTGCAKNPGLIWSVITFLIFGARWLWKQQLYFIFRALSDQKRHCNKRHRWISIYSVQSNVFAVICPTPTKSWICISPILSRPITIIGYR